MEIIVNKNLLKMYFKMGNKVTKHEIACSMKYCIKLSYAQFINNQPILFDVSHSLQNSVKKFNVEFVLLKEFLNLLQNCSNCKP